MAAQAHNQIQRDRSDSYDESVGEDEDNEYGEEGEVVAEFDGEDDEMETGD